MEAASIAHAHGHGHDDHHHGPPVANQSSRVETQLLGMMLFIISEIMVFGAFFTAYFFIRVVHNGQPPPHWFPIHGHDLPKAVAGVNTAIMNAVQYFHISEIVISTLPEGSSQWVADKLVERVRDATQVTVEHIESQVKAEA